MNELELRIIAATDPLTGLATRRAFISALEDARDSASDVALISVDLDHFKSINDTYGHPVGDEVLRSVAAALLSTCPDCAVTGRLGGEELAVLVTGEEARRAAGLAEAIRTAIEAARIDGLEDLDFTASVGLAGCDPAAGPEDWMDLADRALYAAKNAGRNRVEASAA